MLQKNFIITVDTEGDNLWEYKKGEVITTKNAKFIPRFQELCEKFGFKPVYFTNYEMLCNDEYVSYVKAKEQKGLCEVGLHLHAWNNPPIYELDAIYDGNPYLMEYPDEIMRAKFQVLYDLFCVKIGHEPISHRAGRWAMDERYFRLLEDFNVPVDCSVTPHIDWSSANGETMGGSDYRKYCTYSHKIGNILEVPLTVLPSRRPLSHSLVQNIKTIIKGKSLQLRPASCSLREMKFVIDTLSNRANVDYVEFMLHSSELMPGGSPYFANDDAIEEMYKNIESIFEYAQTKHYVGLTIKEYYESI